MFCKNTRVKTTHDKSVDKLLQICSRITSMLCSRTVSSYFVDATDLELQLDKASVMHY